MHRCVTIVVFCCRLTSAIRFKPRRDFVREVAADGMTVSMLAKVVGTEFEVKLLRSIAERHIVFVDVEQSRLEELYRKGGVRDMDTAPEREMEMCFAFRCCDVSTISIPKQTFTKEIGRWYGEAGWGTVEIRCCSIVESADEDRKSAGYHRKLLQVTAHDKFGWYRTMNFCSSKAKSIMFGVMVHGKPL
jgi:hypothetical protein